MREGARVALDVTAFYPTGGGQPHDTGTLDGRRVTDVRKDGDTRVAHDRGRRYPRLARGCTASSIGTVGTG